MTKKEKRLLIRQAIRLTTLGFKLEWERGRVKRLVGSGVSFSAPNILAASERFSKTAAEWQRLEIEHMALKRKP